MVHMGQAVKQTGSGDSEPRPVTQDPAKLRRARVLAGLSVTAAAQAAGYSKAHLSSIEAGVHGASPRCLKALAEVYQSTVDDLLPAA